MPSSRRTGQRCWCEAAAFSTELLARVPEAERGVSCICAACAAAEASIGSPPAA
jgi:hypothetical protein